MMVNEFKKIAFMLFLFLLVNTLLGLVLDAVTAGFYQLLHVDEGTARQFFRSEFFVIAGAGILIFLLKTFQYEPIEIAKMVVPGFIALTLLSLDVVMRFWASHNWYDTDMPAEYAFSWIFYSKLMIFLIACLPLSMYVYFYYSDREQ